MKYSVIIPCYNEARVIAKCLASVNAARANRDDVQIIVVDNGSTDASPAIAASHADRPDDCVVATPRLKISAVRNSGAHAACGEYLLFLDGDIQVPEHWLDTLDTWFGQQRSDVLGFVDLPPAHAPWFARAWGERVLARRDSAREVDFLPGRNINLARVWFDKVGGFNETLMTGEDKDFILRLTKAGARVMTDRSLDVIHHGYEQTFREWLRKEYWRQHSHIDLLRQNGLSLRLLRFPLLAVAHLLMATTLLLSLFIPKAPLLLFITLWLLPSLGMTLRSREHRASLLSIAQFTFLYWVRFHVAGVSIVRALLEQSERFRSPA